MRRALTAALAGFIATLAAPAAAAAGPARAPAPAPAACGPVVTDPLVEPPWGLTRLRPDLAWPLSTGAGVTVAVIDSGVSPDHPTLAGKVLSGADFVLSGSSQASGGQASGGQASGGQASGGQFGGGSGQCDENGHGTLIAGIIAGREATSAGYRFHGVAPGAAIVPVRVLRDQRRATEGDLSDRIATAIRWVVDQRGAGVVNLSLTTPPTPQLDAAVQHALGKGAVVVAAAGNQSDGAGSNQKAYPAAYPGVIAVAGVDGQDAHVASSTAGDYVDVAAPGVRIAGPSPAGGGYLFTAEGGTSFATAYVAGVAALIRAYDPDLPPDQVARRISETADHPANLWNPQVGHGVVNPARAVGALRPAGGARAADPAAGRVAPPVRTADPMGTVKAAAWWIVLVGGTLALLALLAVPVVQRGRRRHWRPGL